MIGVPAPVSGLVEELPVFLSIVVVLSVSDWEDLELVGSLLLTTSKCPFCSWSMEFSNPDPPGSDVLRFRVSTGGGTICLAADLLDARFAL